MKYILILFVLISSAATAQVDSSKLPITLTFKEKHIEIMGNILRLNNTLADQRVRDSLILYLNGGNNPERVVTTRFTAGFVLRFTDAMLATETGVGYNTFNELATSVAPAWPGLVAQLLIKSNQVGSEQGVSKWLFRNADERFKAKAAVLNQIRASGKAWLISPLNYN